MFFLKTTISFSDNKENKQVIGNGNLKFFLKNTNKISDNKEKGQVS